MLYNPDRHEPIVNAPWDEDAARDAIHQIVTDATLSFDSVQFWPVHPRDGSQGVLKGLWNGAAGVVWALHFLAESGVAPTSIDCADAIARVHARCLVEDDPKTYSGSFLIGEIGILLVHWQITHEKFAADRLFNLIDENAEQPSNELMWGAPGTALAASFMWEWTNDERWHDIFLRKIDEVCARWEYRPEFDCFLWRQRFYRPEPRIYLGPVHGFAGNAAVMMRAAPLMTEERREEMYDRIARAIRITADVEDGYANWRGIADGPPGDANRPFILDGAGWLVQWCHGAPGTLGAISSFPENRDATIDRLFIEGGELTWAAGPLTKGRGLCHGTGGNGILFLKLYHRTGDKKWLDRALAFAMHAINQYRQLRPGFGYGWNSLWTGDVGVAVYLQQCITNDSGFPTLDFF